jgi:hypothetical protein
VWGVDACIVKMVITIAWVGVVWQVIAVPFLTSPIPSPINANRVSHYAFNANNRLITAVNAMDRHTYCIIRAYLTAHYLTM